MNHDQTHRTTELSDPNSSAAAPDASDRGLRRGARVLFIAASALGVAAIPGVADRLLSALGSTIVSTARAATDACHDEVLPGYEEGVLKFLQENGVELPKGIESFVSLLELANDHDATFLRDRKIALYVTGKGQVLPAPAGLYVFPDFRVVEILEKGLIGKVWGHKFDPEVGLWAMCRANGGEDGPFVTC